MKMCQWGYLKLVFVIKKECWEGHWITNNTHFQVSGSTQRLNNHESSFRFVPLELTPSSFWHTTWVAQPSCRSYLLALKGQDPPRRWQSLYDKNFYEGQENYYYIRSQKATADFSVDKVAQSPVKLRWRDYLSTQGNFHCRALTKA